MLAGHQVAKEGRSFLELCIARGGCPRTQGYNHPPPLPVSAVFKQRSSYIYNTPSTSIERAEFAARTAETLRSRCSPTVVR